MAITGSSSCPTVARRHGRSSPRRPSTEKLVPDLNFYVTVMKRSEEPEPVQIILDPFFNVEPDYDLENGSCLCRFRMGAIDNLFFTGGSTLIRMLSRWAAGDRFSR